MNGQVTRAIHKDAGQNVFWRFVVATATNRLGVRYHLTDNGGRRRDDR